MSEITTSTPSKRNTTGTPVELPDDLVRIRDAAERRNVNTKTLRRRIADGELRAWRMGGKGELFVSLSEADACLFHAVPTVAATG